MMSLSLRRKGAARQQRLIFIQKVLCRSDELYHGLTRDPPTVPTLRLVIYDDCCFRRGLHILTESSYIVYGILRRKLEQLDGAK